MRSLYLFIVVCMLLLSGCGEKETYTIKGTIVSKERNEMGTEWLGIVTEDGLSVTVYERGSSSFLTGMKIGYKVSIETELTSDGYKAIGVNIE